MSGEMRIARGALGWGAAGAVVAAVVALIARGPDGAASALIAAGLVLGNAALQAVISTVAGKVSNVGGAMIALPSFAVRLSLLFAALALLNGRAFIDEVTFAVAFCAALTLVLFGEARAFRRTPWLAMSFGEKERV